MTRTAADGALRAVVLSLALVCSVTDQAAAQDPGEPGAAAGRGAAALTPGEVAAMLDAYAAVQAQQALGLDEPRYADFVPRLRALQEARRKGRQGHARAIQDLRRLTADRTAAKYDEAAVRDRLMALRDLEDRSAAEIRRAADAVDQVLDLRQQARFRVFEEMIERRKLDLVLRARQKARQDASQP